MEEFFRNLPYGRVFDLAESIKLHHQLVLSKNVCSSQALDMTLYSFDGGEGITWQTIPNDLLLLVLQGKVKLEYEEQKGEIIEETGHKAQAIYIPAEKSFQISGENAYKLNFIVLNKGVKDMFIKNFEMGKVVELKDQVSLVEGSIASKTLVNSPAMTMTLFAFDAGQGVSTHSAPGDAFVVCLQGQAEVVLNGETLTVKEGQSVIMPANVPHSVKATSPYKMLLTVVKA